MKRCKNNPTDSQTLVRTSQGDILHIGFTHAVIHEDIHDTNLQDWQNIAIIFSPETLPIYKKTIGKKSYLYFYEIVVIEPKYSFL